mmetsp:Transcript_28983/g.52991  ORF Transcript_28983/g.52991 Transcript_28983/m.52991 type:complete len:171 (-) Transcript_28983:87-599(-)
MESSSQSPPPAPYVSRTEMRRAVHDIIRRVLQQRLAEHRAAGDVATAASRPNKAQRRRAVQQSHVLEEIIYRRSCSIEEYQDLSTLEQRVFNAGRAVYITSQRREMERAVRNRRMAMDHDGDGDEAVVPAGDESEEESTRRSSSPKAVEPIDETAQRSESLVLSNPTQGR